MAREVERMQGMTSQPTLFDAAPSGLPEGFRYQPDLITPDEESEILRNMKELPFRNFEFHGYVGKRRVVSFGWRYDFNDGELRKADDIPEFLTALRDQAATFAGIAPTELRHALVTEYEPGAAMGWHRDKDVFGDVIGVSLLSACVFRLRRKVGMKWKRASITAEPRSVYLLRGAARSDWEHSIPAVAGLRYSITFRSMRPPR